MVLVAGGIGLRAAAARWSATLLADRERYGEVTSSTAGARPRELLYVGELERWRGRFDVDVDVTVDARRRRLARPRRRRHAADPARASSTPSARSR